MKFLLIFLLFFNFRAAATEILKIDGIVTVYSSKTDLNATILYSEISKGIYVSGRGYQYFMKVIQDWKVEPWRADYFYFINETVTKSEMEEFY